MTRLTDAELHEALAQLPEWSEFDGQIQRTFGFPDFVESIKFVNAVADYAQRAQHHPDILIRYNKVTLTVSTHDADGVTEKDFALARHADALI
ncbi:MAG: 4a-hydroxytetrahydrobiopterin dehydratase [Phycisphaeraceae bacterium]|nr:4a-hydroxytetrahydrobiopterin dehydratase [Phycisphaeraceae bacterium]MCW5764050.1 4a-hydroxytetrahydrobiopterin dehydratase [Phycisphaeraceae bacterium]